MGRKISIGQDSFNNSKSKKKGFPTVEILRQEPSLSTLLIGIGLSIVDKQTYLLSKIVGKQKGLILLHWLHCIDMD